MGNEHKGGDADGIHALALNETVVLFNQSYWYFSNLTQGLYVVSVGAEKLCYHKRLTRW